MFKRLKKSVIDKNNLLSTNLSKKRVNKTPSKMVFPNLTNLTLANIIVNMNSTPSFKNIDSWNNSYFKTELSNNSFSNKYSKNSIIDISKNTIDTKDENSEILLIIINGILSLKSKDLLNYCTKLIEIITYIRDNNDKDNYIEVNVEANKELLIIIYQIYFRIFPEKSFIYITMKNDLKKGMQIFTKIHSMFILYIFTGLSYINDNMKINKIEFYNFLKRFIKKEKCFDSRCPICANIENFDKNFSSNQKTSVIKIMERKFKNNNIINNRINKYSKNIINISNDNNGYKKIKLDDNIGRKYNSNIINGSSKEKNLIITNRSKNDLGQIKKKIFYSQIINTSEKEKARFFNHSLTKNKKQNLKKNKIIKKQEKNNEINNSKKIDSKRYNTETNEFENKNIEKIEGHMLDKLKIKLSKNNNNQEKDVKNKIKKFNKIMDLNDNNTINNNKINEINKSNKNQLAKTKKIKINIFNDNDSKIKTERRICINLDISDKKKNNSNYKEAKKENKMLSPNLSESSKIISNNINLMEKEINAFKEHNLFIKQQFEKMFNYKK